MYIYGAGGHAKVIIDTLGRMGRHVEGVYDDRPASSPLNGRYPFMERWIDGYDPDKQCIVAVGNCAVRKEIVSRGELNWGMAIDPSAGISDSACIGPGSVVMRGVCVNADTRIGSHVILNTRCCVDHDCLIGDFAHIAPMAALAGGVCVGEGAMIGIGACVIPGISIGKWAVVGAGAVVIRDVPDYAVVVGNPAKIIELG